MGSRAQLEKPKRDVMGRRAREHGQKGAAMVEFALVLPLLLVLVFGIIEFGLVLYNQQVITNASREGARYGIVARTPRRDAAEITAVVNAYCANNLVTFAHPTNPIVGVDNSEGTSFGKDLIITVSYPYQFLVFPNVVSLLRGETQVVFPGVLTLEARTMMKYE